MENYELLELRDGETLLAERNIKGTSHKRLAIDKGKNGFMVILEDKREEGYKNMAYALNPEEVKDVINKLIMLL